LVHNDERRQIPSGIYGFGRTGLAEYQWGLPALESRSDFFERWGKDFEKVKILRLPPVMAKRQWDVAKNCRASVITRVESDETTLLSPVVSS